MDSLGCFALALAILAMGLLVRSFKDLNMAEKLRFRMRKKRPIPRVEAGCAEYYRLYKYIYMQQKIGIDPFETIRRLYLITEHRGLRRLLYEMSVRMSNSNELESGLSLLREKLVGDDSRLFINILENSLRTGFDTDAMRQMDSMFFQKYLIDIRKKVKRVKRSYFRAALCFCLAISIGVFLPVLEQMLQSLQSIFTSF